MNEVHGSGVAEASLSEPFIGKREVARRLGKTVRTVDNWMRRGMLPYYKCNRTVAFRWSEERGPGVHAGGIPGARAQE
jgi:hypothetical protein